VEVVEEELEHVDVQQAVVVVVVVVDELL